MSAEEKVKVFVIQSAPWQFDKANMSMLRKEKFCRYCDKVIRSATVYVEQKIIFWHIHLVWLYASF